MLFLYYFQGNLASILSTGEWGFISQTLLSTPDYDKKSIYWLGGSIDQNNQLGWVDHMPFNFSGTCVTKYYSHAQADTHASLLSTDFFYYNTFSYVWVILGKKRNVSYIHAYVINKLYCRILSW